MRLLFTLLFLLCFSCDAKDTFEKAEIRIKTSNGDTHSLTVELAKTEEQREQGFMFREKIPEGTGMLFVFQKDERLAFWMKNTPSPLSIAYISSSGEIRAIFDMEPFNEKSVVSPFSVRYALEVPQGWFDKAGIKVGDSVDLNDI